MRQVRLIPAVLACVLSAACAPSYYRQAQGLARAGDHAAAVPLYYREIQATPAGHAAWRELGVSLYEQGELARAEEALKQAAGMHPDARTQLYLGLVLEKQDRPEPALRAYGHALSLEPGGATRDLLEARVTALTAIRVRQEVQRSLANEKELATATMPDSTVAVVEFAGEGLPAGLAPLTKGLAELTAHDLGKIGSLRVVDRLKIDAIRKELALGQSEFADPVTAPRIGHLVGGRRIVTGTLLGLGDVGVRLDGAVVNTADRSVQTAAPAEGPLAEIFRVQKEFVFDVIKAMDIVLTPAERSEIEKVPTENYLAFLAYCRGLDCRDRNDLGGAQAEFQKAAAADRGFAQAATQNRQVSVLLSTGLGTGTDFGAFNSLVGAASAGEAEAGGLKTFSSTMVTWNGFVPFGTLGPWADSPPHTLFQGSVDVIVRGNLNVQP